jgi:hypothetical protein
MAAFHINGQSTNDVDKAGVFSTIMDWKGGKIILGLLILGLICYSIWRVIQAFGWNDEKDNRKKNIAVKIRYFFSGLVYASLSLFAIKMLFFDDKGSGDNKQDMVQSLLNKWYGQWAVGLVALIFIGVGIYQIYYGLSEKYRKHASMHRNNNEQILLIAGKVGYIARGIVWLIIGWLFVKAALHSNSSEAGDTSEAFGFLSESDYGTYLLAAMGVGLLCYGLFNFIRVRYDRML